MVGFRKDRIDIWSANTVAMQPLVSSVTLVSFGPALMGTLACTFTHMHTQTGTYTQAHSSPCPHSGSVS